MPISSTKVYIGEMIPNPTDSFDLNTTGANIVWDFRNMLRVDTTYELVFKSPGQVNVAYSFLLPSTCYGYKLMDSLPMGGGGLPISISNVYNYFEKNNTTSTFNTVGISSLVSGLPTASIYSNKDELYYFPMTYSKLDSGTFEYTISFGTLASLQSVGKRKNNVDGWGTIKTPNYPNGIPCLRLKSEVEEMDSINFNGTKYGIPRQFIQYKWMSDTLTVPILEIEISKNAGLGKMSRVRFRNNSVGTSIYSLSKNTINGYPNPTRNYYYLNNYYSSLKVFDINGKIILSQTHSNQIDLSNFPKGIYVLIAIQNENVFFDKIIKE